MHTFCHRYFKNHHIVTITPLSIKCIMCLVLLLPPATKLGQGYVFTCVCDSVHRGRSVSVHAGIPTHPQQGRPALPPPPGKTDPTGKETPWQGDPPGKETPLARRPTHKADPPAQCMLGDTVYKWAVCILLECNSCLQNINVNSGGCRISHR